MNQSDLEAITRITRYSREKSELGSNGLRKWREFFFNQSQFEVKQTQNKRELRLPLNWKLV